MSLGRQQALKRLVGHGARVEEHLAKIAAHPEDQENLHWQGEVAGWIARMEADLRHVGKKTAAAWSERIAAWKDRLGGERHAGES